MPMRPLGGAIDRALRKLGLERDVAQIPALDAWPAAAAEVLGRGSEATHAVGFDDQVLVVSVPDAAWGGEIRLRERALVEALARRARGSDIVRIRTVPAHQLKRPSDA